MHKTPPPGPVEHTQAHTGTPRSAQWLYRGPWLGRVAGRAGRIVGPNGRVAASCRAPSRACSSACACSQLSLACRARSCRPAHPSAHACACCTPQLLMPARRVAATVAVLQYSTAQPQSQYSELYCDTILPTANVSATIQCSVLGYSFCLLQPLPATIQDIVSQYNFLTLSPPCNTISQYKMGSSKFPISAPFFFSFFFHYNQIFIFFIYFQQLKKSLKSLKIIFFPFL